MASLSSAFQVLDKVFSGQKLVFMQSQVIFIDKVQQGQSSIVFTRVFHLCSITATHPITIRDLEIP